MSEARKNERRAVAAVLALALSGLAAFHFHWAPETLGGAFGADDAAYVSLARSLACGHGYVRAWDPDMPPETKYPPLFPLSLAAIIKAAGQNYRLMHLFVALCLVACPGAAYLLFRETDGPGPALAAGLFFATLPAVTQYSRLLLSEFPFTLLALASLFFLGRWRRDNSVAAFLMSLGLAAAALLTRTIGLALAGGCLAAISTDAELRARKFRAVPFWLVWALVVAAAQGGWSARNALAAPEGSSRDYGSELLLKDPDSPWLGNIGAADLGRRAGGNAIDYALALSRDLSGWRIKIEPPGPAGQAGLGLARASIVPAVILALVLAGLVSLFRRGPPEAGFFVVFYMAILLAWPYREWSRFLLPVMPLLALCLFRGAAGALALALRAVFKKDRAHAAGRAVLALFCLTIAANAAVMLDWARIAREPMWYPGRTVDAGELGQVGRLVDFSKTSSFLAGPGRLMRAGEARIALLYIGEVLPPDAVAVSRADAYVWLETGRRSAWPPPSRDPDELLGYLRSKGATHVLFTGLSFLEQKRLEPLQDYYPGLLKKVYQSPMGTAEVYELRDDGR